MMCDLVARTSWSNIENNYCVDTIIIFDLSYNMNITITVTFMNQAMLCHAFFFFPPKYYSHKSCTIFHIDLYVFNIHTKTPNVTNKLYHVKRSASFKMNLLESHTAEWIIFAMTEKSVCLPLFKTPFTTVVLNGFLLSMKGLSSTNQSPFPSFFWLGGTNNAAKPNCVIPTEDDGSSNDSRSFGKLICYLNQGNTALKEAAIVSKMQTQEINEKLLSRKQQSCQKCKHRQSHFDFPNTDSKKISTWISLLKRNNLLAKLCFS